ncbi:MAG: hypothetical protein JWQ23_892, partial [Herminiimonas sp.]|nr:hypothetical protein [Herminiimonas sp.]
LLDQLIKRLFKLRRTIIAPFKRQNPSVEPYRK